MTLDRYDPTDQQRSWVQLMAPAVELAKAIADTEFVPSSMRGNAAVVAAAILYGDEVGLGPMQSLAKISVIDGRPSLAAESQRALILAAGHDVWVEEATTERVTVAGRRRGSDQVTRFTWTMDDARRASLAGKPNWTKYPRQMLGARASAELARALFADVIGGLAAAEELEDADAPTSGDPWVPVIPAETAAKAKPKNPRTRKRTATTPPAETGSPSATDTPSDAQGAPGRPPGDDPPPFADDPAPTLTAELEASVAQKMTDQQRKKMHALFREAGVTDHDERVAIASTVVGRTVTTSADLTVGEAALVIDALASVPDAPPSVDDAPPEP